MARTPTPQQASCIEGLIAHRMLRISACAGSGKTSTLTMMAEANPVPSLYLAFNKVTATEAAEKFPAHVTCRTTHSIAYSVFGTQIRDKLTRPRGKYVNVAGTGSEIARFYNIQPIVQAGEVVLSAAYLGLLVKTTVARFEQSADAEVTTNHVPHGELREKLKTITFNKAYVEGVVLNFARQLWQHRINVNSPVLATHDTYLKMYQLSKPVLAGFDILYVDEFQDTTPCVLDIVLNQRKHMKVVMVGDARQAIYGWRGAVNAMKMVDCEERMLTKSFRYGQAVADIATKVLLGDMKITGNDQIASVTSFDCVDTSQPYTRLFRTNAALLGAAVEELKNGTEISIEIDVKDFVKILTSAVALKDGDTKGVKHDKIIPYTDWVSLTEESKFDPELARIAKVVNGGQADEWINTLENHVNSDNPHVTFTTAHKSKGREFKQVIVEGDFKSCYNEDGEFVGLPEEEQNLLYVAVTRAIDRLNYNQTVAEYIRHWDAMAADPDVALELEYARISDEYDNVVAGSIAQLNRDMYEAIAA